jgi:hypothetical protein
MRRKRETDGRTDMTNLIVAFRNLANSSEKSFFPKVCPSFRGAAILMFPMAEGNEVQLQHCHNNHAKKF